MQELVLKIDSEEYRQFFGRCRECYDLTIEQLPKYGKHALKCISANPKTISVVFKGLPDAFSEAVVFRAVEDFRRNGKAREEFFFVPPKSAIEIKADKIVLSVENLKIDFEFGEHLETINKRISENYEIAGFVSLQQNNMTILLMPPVDIF